MPDPSNGRPTLHALLIAVDYYLSGQMPDGSFYPALGGCVRDVNHVAGFLKGTLKVPDERVALLISAPPAVQNPNDPLPTYENMVGAIRALTDRAARGDQVYIHYSGHGGRAATIYPDRKGPAGLDETLVPYNINRKEGQYLRDLEIAELLKGMTAKGLIVTLIFDCCHSGGVTRGALNNVATRGVDFIDRTPRPTPSLVPLAEGTLTRNVSLGAGILPEPKGYAMIAACRESESAYEFPFVGTERNGALTYWLLDILGKVGTGLSYKMLHERVLARIHSQFERQTPMIEGEVDRAVFGIETIPAVTALIVMAVDMNAPAPVLLGTGQALGARSGSQFAIYPQEAVDLTSAAGRKAVVEITALGATESRAKIVSTGPTPGADIAPGDHAVMLGAGSTKLVRGVRLIGTEGQPITDRDTALKAVEAALQAAPAGWVEIAAPEKPADFLVTLTKAGDEYELCDTAGVPLKNLRPALKVSDPGAAASVVKRLVHLAKYRTVQDLDNFDDSSPLKGKLVVDLAGVQDDFQPGERPAPQPFPQSGGKIPSLRVGQWTFLRIRNTSKAKLNVAVLDLQPDWGVTQVFPTPNQGLFKEVGPGEELPLRPLQASLPGGYTDGTDTLKVLATVGQSNFRVLELPSLDQPSTGRVSLTRGPGSALDQLLATAAADTPTTRALTPANSPSEEWTMVQIEVQIRSA